VKREPAQVVLQYLPDLYSASQLDESGRMNGKRNGKRNANHRQPTIFPKHAHRTPHNISHLAFTNVERYRVMRMFILNADSSNRMESVVISHLYSHLNVVSNINEADIVIVGVSYFHDYRFNEALRGINKPWVLVDFVEYCWDWQPVDTHVFGKNTSEFRKRLESNFDQWMLFDEFVRNRPPIMYFKRELLSKDATNRLKPIEYLCYMDAQPIQNRDEFDARSIDVFYNWGESNPLRPRLHGEIFTKKNYGIISQWDHLDTYFHHNASERKVWVSIFTPHFSRVHYGEIIRAQSRSKISVSLPGCGMKCFRHSEANVGAIMALTDDKLAWSYPFEHGVNCIVIRRDCMHDDLLEATRRSDLYEIYLRSQETADKYRPRRYVDEYFIPSIRSIL